MSMPMAKGDKTLLVLIEDDLKNGENGRGSLLRDKDDDNDNMLSQHDEINAHDLGENLAFNIFNNKVYNVDISVE